MLEGIGMPTLGKIVHTLFAQVPPRFPVVTPEETALIFSGPRFFTALIAGIALAFAFQLVLTNLSVAAGMTYLGHQDDSDTSSSSSSNHSGGVGKTIRKISFGVGLWTLLTVSIALFLACFFAVKLSLLLSPALGAIVGLVIWAAYFTLLVWISSATVGSLVGSVVNTLTSGFQSMLSTATAALGGKMMGDRTVATAEAAAAAVRRELTSGLDATTIRNTLEDYLEALRPPQLDFKKIRGDLENMLRDPEFQTLASTESLGRINRQTFVNLIGERTDLSKQEINRLADQLDSTWRQVMGQRSGRGDSSNPVGDLQKYLASALPEQLRSNDLSNKLDQLISAIAKNNSNANNSTGNNNTGNNNTGDGNTHNDQKDAQQSGGIASALQTGIVALMGTVMQRQDLSDLDVEKILGKLNSIRHQLSDQGGKLVSQVASANQDASASMIRADVEHYLQTTYTWQLNPAVLEREFQSVLYDPEADPAAVRQQLELMNREFFRGVLAQRGLLTQEQLNETVEALERGRLEAIAKARAAEVQEQIQELRYRTQRYLQAGLRSEILSENLQYEFAKLMTDAEVEPEAMLAYLTTIDPAVLRQFLNEREVEPLSPEEIEQVLQQLRLGRDRALQEAEARRAAEQSQLQAAQVRLENYLRNTHRDELNPESIKRDLQTLASDPQAGVSALRNRFSQFDRNTLVQLLNQRQDLSEEQINQVLDQVETNWDRLVHAPQNLATQARDQYDNLTQQLADYLRRTDRAELNPEGIQRDLKLLMNDPKTGMWALRRRLSQIDRETLVKLLSQRQDLSEEQVNQVIDQIQSTLRQLVRAPRRLATRTQERVFNFESSLEDYLRNTNREEFNPDGIKRDLGLLLNDPRAGFSNLGDRLSHIDRASLVALLSQRQDMTEEEANRVVDQIFSVRDQFMAQIHGVQSRIQSMIDQFFERIRQYLNSLERPELNYEGVQRDIRQLFSDPQAGFEALRDRLSHFNRDTVVAILSSRDDISQADVNRLLDQVEFARTSVLRRAERFQHETKARLDELKRQAQKQANETRKAAESAAWWLFGTAITSALVSALAGAIAVGR